MNITLPVTSQKLSPLFDHLDLSIAQSINIKALHLPR